VTCIVLLLGSIILYSTLYTCSLKFYFIVELPTYVFLFNVSISCCFIAHNVCRQRQHVVASFHKVTPRWRKTVCNVMAVNADYVSSVAGAIVGLPC